MNNRSNNCNDHKTETTNTINTMSAKIVSIYSSDTSGVCSALYELGGMVVVHDASGCNSTYTTHDEPRWYDHKSMIYISALTEADAIMGNDEKFINDVCKAAQELTPRFICICGSPMPAMIGTDFDYAASQIELRTGIKTFFADTNGTYTYLHGASQAFRLLAESFCEKRTTHKGSVNIIGATPLDLSINSTLNSIKALLTENGFSIKSCFAMGSSLDEISSAAEAEADLVVSSDGISAAEYLRDRFGIPYVVGIPFGKGFSKAVAEDLRLAAEKNVCINSCLKHRAPNISDNSRLLILGESVFAASLAAELGGTVISTVEGSTNNVLTADDIVCYDHEEERLEGILSQLGSYDTVIADPLFKPLCAKSRCRFVPLPQVAFSGRCFLKDIPDLINTDCKELLKL